MYSEDDHYLQECSLHEDEDITPAVSLNLRTLLLLSYYYVREILNGFNVDDEKIEEFEDEFGSICSTKNLHHFLMKYQWRNNGWDDEMAENYFSWSIKDFMDLVGSYAIAFNAFYMLPYYREQWFEHELYPLDANTHAQFILRRW